MKKTLSILFLSLMTLSLTVFAKDRISPVAHTQEYYEMNANQDFNFSDSANYLTEEQLQDAQEVDQIDDKSSWLDKIINSSHFSSQTATKTYIPINKVQK